MVAIARDPATRIRDIAAACHVTQRTAQSIVGYLDQVGYLSREREGRRTHYTHRLDGRLRIRRRPTCLSGPCWRCSPAATAMPG
ncbi:MULTISPECIES: hypothetical protein [unclassified Streptomyces]|uniref:hypothetical protein n=1 Tax=unclassified Streptomyces TaxID=2593676 RepID=UPI00381A25C9